LPSGYKAPVVVYLGQETDERDGHAYQLGAFKTGARLRRASRSWRLRAGAAST